MTSEEALLVLDKVLPPVRLNHTQQSVFHLAWLGKTFRQMAIELNFDENHMRDVGAKLWKTLGTVCGQEVNRRNFKAVVQTWIQNHPIRVADSPPPTSHQDWGEAVDVSTFFGRSQELETLKHWVIVDRCRVVALLGMGGIGKTSLSVKLAQEVQQEFGWLIWRSLRNAPPLKELLIGLIQFLANGDGITLPDHLDDLRSSLIHYLRERRCLIILDNTEAILSSEHPRSHDSSYAGHYRHGYEDYGDFFRILSEVPHQSCLLLTSREEPKEIDVQKGEWAPVRSLQLKGLSSSEGQEIFKIRGTFAASNADWERLVQHYAGNPLALKMVSSVVKELFNSDLSQFIELMEQGALVFSDIRDLLDRQLERLSDSETEVMYWLAINREPVTLAELQEDVLSPTLRHRLPEVLKSLGRRLVIERISDSFTQQPVVMEYLIEQFVEQVCQEMAEGQINLLMSHAFIKAQAKSYVRESQMRMILQPIADRLCDLLKTTQNVELKIKQLLLKLQTEFAHSPGYAAGNLINLLQKLNLDLTGYDFSNLVVWQAQLQGSNLHRVNFANADLAKSVFTETIGNVWAVSLSHDGRLLAATDLNHTHLWQLPEGKKLFTLHQLSGANCIAFDPQGQILASGDEDATIKLWDTETGQCLRTLEGHRDWLLAVAFNPDGSLFASSSADGTVKLWNIASGKCLHTLHGHTNWIRGIAFAPSVNGDSSGSESPTILVSGSADDTLRFWDVDTGECLRVVPANSRGIWSIAFSPDGQTFATGGADHTVKLWDRSSGKCLKVLQGHQHHVRSVAFSPEDYCLISGSEDNTVRLWDSRTGECLQVLHGHTGDVWSVACARHHLLASGSLDQQIKLWDTRSGQCLSTLKGYSSAVLTVAIAPANHRLPEKLTDPSIPQPEKEFLESEAQTLLDFPPLLASGSADHSIQLWELDSGECLNTLHGHTNWVLSVAFSPTWRGTGGLLASSGFDQTIRLWDVRTGICQRILKGHTNWVRSVQFSPDGCTLLSCSFDQTIRLWDVATGECLKILQGHHGRLFSASFSPNGSWIASTGDDSDIWLWDAKTGECLQKIQGHTERIWSVAFSPNGQLLASGSRDCTVRIWEADTGKCLHILRGHTRRVESVAFSSDSTLLASGSEDKTIKLWQVETGEYLTTLQGHREPVWAVAFGWLSDLEPRQIIASGGEDETIRIWDATTYECLKTLSSPRPYQGMNITGATGLTEAQKATLKALGAIEVR